MAKREDMKKLEEMCKPIVEFLKENYSPYATVVITDTHIRLTRDEFGIPVNKELTAQEVLVQEQSVAYINLDENFTKEVIEKISELNKLLNQEPKIITYQKI